MARDRDIILPHSEIGNSQTITERNVRAFSEAGLDIHKNDVVALEDDFKKGERRLKVRNVKYFGPWSKRG